MILSLQIFYPHWISRVFIVMFSFKTANDKIIIQFVCSYFGNQSSSIKWLIAMTIVWCSIMGAKRSMEVICRVVIQSTIDFVFICGSEQYY